MWSSQEQSLYYFDTTPIWNHDFSVSACRQLATLKMMEIEHGDMLDKQDFLSYLLQSDLMPYLQSRDHKIIPDAVFNRIENITYDFFNDPSAFSANRYPERYIFKRPQIGQILGSIMAVGGTVKDSIFSIFFTEDKPNLPKQNNSNSGKTKGLNTEPKKTNKAHDLYWQSKINPNAEALFYLNPKMVEDYPSDYQKILDAICEQFVSRNKTNTTYYSCLSNQNPPIFHGILQERLEQALLSQTQAIGHIMPLKKSVAIREQLELEETDTCYPRILTYLQLLELNGYHNVNTQLLEAIVDLLTLKSELCQGFFKASGIDLETTIRMASLKAKEYDLTRSLLDCLPRKTSLIRRVISYIRITALRLSLMINHNNSLKKYLFTLPKTINKMARMIYSAGCMTLFYLNHMIVGINPKSQLLPKKGVEFSAPPKASAIHLNRFLGVRFAAKPPENILTPDSSSPKSTRSNSPSDFI